MAEAHDTQAQTEAAPAEIRAQQASSEFDQLTDFGAAAGFGTAAARAARLLAGGRAGVPRPDPRARLSPGAALALQRTIGNRALSRRMLMRFDWDGDGSDEPDETMQITAGGPNDAATQAATYLDEGPDIDIVVLDAKRAFVYDRHGKPKGTFEFLVPTAFSPGVFVSGKNSASGKELPFLRVYMVNGVPRWDWRRDSSQPIGAMLSKPPSNAATAARPKAKPDPTPAGAGDGALGADQSKSVPTYEGGLVDFVKDSAGMRAALTSGNSLLVIPKYTAGKRGGKGGGKDGATGSMTAALSGKDKGEPPNAPAYPATITGNDQQVAGGRSTYTMELEYGSNSIGNVLAAMNYVTYTWERWELSHATKDSPRATLEGASIAGSAKDAAHESGAMDATGRRWADSAREESENLRSAWKGTNPQPGQSVWSAIKDRLSNDVALALAPASWLVSIGGNLLDTAVDAAPQRHVEHEMPWPDKMGLYCVRCIAQPDAQVAVDQKGKETVVRRAASVATLLVEVKDAKQVSKEAADKPEADLANAQLALDLAIQQGATKEVIDKLRKARDQYQLAARGSSVDLLLAALDAKQKELAACDPADYIKRGQITEQIDAVREQVDLTGKRAYSIDPTGKTKPVRLTASFVSRITGQPYPLLLDLYECPDSKDGAYHYQLSDVTSKDAAANPDATDTDRKQAILDVLNLYSQRSGLGLGSLTVRIPAWLIGGDTKDQPSWFQQQTADVGWALAKKRLSDLALIASIVGTVLLGPEAAVAGRLLMVAGAIGGAAAAINIIDRVQSDTFRWDSSAIQDVIAIIGAVAPGVSAIGKLQILKLGENFRIFAEVGDVAAAEAALQSLKTTETGLKLFEAANHAIGQAGVFLSGVDTIEKIQAIGRAERAGEISHNEAERQRAAAISSAVLQTTMTVFGQEAGKANERRANEGNLTDKQVRDLAHANEEAERRIAEHDATEGTLKTLEELKGRKAALDKQIAHLEALKGAQDELARKQEELRASEQELANKFAELEALEHARQKAGAGKDKGPPAGGPPGGGAPGGEGPPSSRPGKPITKAQAAESFKRAVAGTGDPARTSLDLINTVGDWKAGIKGVLAALPEGLRGFAAQALVTARDQIVDRAWDKVTGTEPRFKDLFRMNVGTKAFSSDIDITIRPTDEALRAAGTDVAKLIALSTEAATKFKEALRNELGGHETDGAIDTNVYSFIGEGVLVPRSAGERTARGDFDRVTGLAEALRGGGKAAFAELLAQTRAKMAGDPAAIAHLNELAVQAKQFYETRVAEETEARKAVQASGGGKLAPDVVTRMMRDRIVEAKKAQLADASKATPPDIGLITRLQAEILWFEPDAYATRAAIEQAVAQAQSLKAAGQSVTPDEDVATARASVEKAQAGGVDAEIQRARDWLAKATSDRDAIQAEQAKLATLQAEPVAGEPAAKAAHDKRVREQMMAVEAAEERFRSRVVKSAVGDIQADLDARGYVPKEQRMLGSAAAAANLGMMDNHIAHAKDAGERVKYACKYGGRVLLALTLGGVKATGSITAEAMLGMFTRSRWTFNEGEPAKILMRDMLVRYANETGKPVNIENGEVKGVSSDVQDAFVRDVASFLRGAAAQLWAVGLTEESLKGNGLEEDLQQAEEHAGEHEHSNPVLAAALAKRDAAVRSRLVTAIENELAAPQPEADKPGQTYQPSQSTDLATMSESYRKAVEQLAGIDLADAEAIRKALPTIQKGLRTPRYYAEVLADAAMLHREQGITINEALVELARRTTLGRGAVYVVDKIPGGYNNEPFFKEVVAKARYFVDNDIDSGHGHMTHLLQDLAVDRALTEAGINDRAPTLRARLARLPGRVGQIAIGDAIWRGTWDNERQEDFGSPEMLKSALGKYGLD